MFSFFKKIKEQSFRIPPYEERVLDNEMINISKQRMQDSKIDFYINSKVSKMISNFEFMESIKDLPLMTRFSLMASIDIIDITPSPCIYYLHHEKTAKYKNSDIGKIIKNRFNELKNKNGSNTNI